MTDGLAVADGHIVLPTGPDSVFVAAKNVAVLERIKAIPPREFCHMVNDTVVRQAVRYVYGVDENQLRFVENRLQKSTGSFTP
jgi:hypothetical protein